MLNNDIFDIFLNDLFGIFKNNAYLCNIKQQVKHFRTPAATGNSGTVIMKATKDTTIKFTSKSGKEVIVTVHREYGAYVEHHHDSEDGIDYDTNEFANDSYISVEVPGVCKFDTKYLPDMKHPKINMYYLSNGRYCIGISDDIAEQIRKAEKERLSDEIDPHMAAVIRQAKTVISNGKVLPAAELNKKRRQYNNAFNEGGEGYNPFDDYLTAEYVATLKKDYPDQF